MARTTGPALILLIGAALALSACGRRGPLEAPGTTPQGVEKPAPAPADGDVPEPEKKPERVLETPGAP